MRPTPLIAPPRRGRRLQDTILTAAHLACDAGETALAAALLRLGETAITTEPDLRRRQQTRRMLVAAHERLWHLRHPAGTDQDLPSCPPRPAALDQLS